MAQERDDLGMTQGKERDHDGSLDVVDRIPPRTEVTNLDSYKSRANSADESDENHASDHIKGRIEETRNQMGETIDAIQDKLSFSNLSEQVSEHVSNAVETAKEAVYDATIGKAATIMKNLGDGITQTTVVKTVKDNPLPFILIGAGAGLLAYKAYTGKSSGGRSYRSEQGDRRFNDERRSGMQTPTALSSAGDAVSGVKDKVTNAAGSVYESVTGAVGSAYSGAGDALGTAYGKVGELGSAAKDQYNTYIEDNPLAVGAVALALGAAVGLAIPATRYEGEMLGETRQKLLDKAEGVAGELIDKTKEIVSDAGLKVKNQAGLTH